jgi:hypothetical protein
LEYFSRIGLAHRLHRSHEHRPGARNVEPISPKGCTSFPQRIHNFTAETLAIRVCSDSYNFKRSLKDWLHRSWHYVSLVAAFLDSGQVGEFIIHVIPKMIGEGIPLVAVCHRDLGLKLLATKSFPVGGGQTAFCARVK